MRGTIWGGLAAMALGVAALTGCSSDSAASLGPDVAPTGTYVQESPCDPRVQNFPYHVAYARSQGELAIYDAPGALEPVTQFPNPRYTDTDPAIAVPLGMLVQSEPTDDNCAWVKVDLPTRPNGSTGWVKRTDIKMEGHVFRLEVRLSEFNLKLYKGSELVVDAPIATATDNTPTPGGTYYVTELIESAKPNGLYGPYALGLSGYSDTVTTYNGGEGQLGIHGTNEPDKIGSQVSHGCIRLHNDDIEHLVSELDTVIGVPVYIYT